MKSWMKPSKKFHRVGRTDDACPSCGKALAKRPQRKTKCPHCGQFIYSRTRPIDQEKVLLNEAQATIVEHDWELDYEIKEAQSRELGPVWAERFKNARKTRCDPDPMVEKLARKAFSDLLLLIREGEAPQHAREKLLPPESDGDLRKRVDIRLWQLQVQHVEGAEY